MLLKKKKIMLLIPKNPPKPKRHEGLNMQPIIENLKHCPKMFEVLKSYTDSNGV